MKMESFKLLNKEDKKKVIKGASRHIFFWILLTLIMAIVGDMLDITSKLFYFAIGFMSMSYIRDFKIR